MAERPDETARALAAAVGLVLPDACLAGVIENLALLRQHLARLDVPDEERP